MMATYDIVGFLALGSNVDEIHQRVLASMYSYFPEGDENLTLRTVRRIVAETIRAIQVIAAEDEE